MSVDGNLYCYACPEIDIPITVTGVAMSIFVFHFRQYMLPSPLESQERMDDMTLVY